MSSRCRSWLGAARGSASEHHHERRRRLPPGRGFVPGPGSRYRPGGDRHHPHPRHRCRAEGPVRPCRRAHGHGAGRLYPLDAVPALRSQGPDLAGPRSLRAVGRPRLDAALQPDPPGRRGGGGQPGRAAGTPRGQPRRHQSLPPARQPHPRPPRISAYHRGGDHHGSPGPGLRQQRRHGHGRAVARGAVQPAGPHAVRLRRLCHLQRRRSDGRRFGRSGVPGRAPEAVEPLLDL